MPLKNVITALVLSYLLTACDTVRYDYSNAATMFAALDTSPDQTEGIIDATSKFLIVSTEANNQLLCRRVKISGPRGQSQRRFCKVKGGDWR